MKKKLKSINQLKHLHSIHSNNLRTVKLNDGSQSVFLKQNSIHKTNATFAYFQCDLENTRGNALVELFCQGFNYPNLISNVYLNFCFIFSLFVLTYKVISESCYNVLRTQEQLGKRFSYQSEK